MGKQPVAAFCDALRGRLEALRGLTLVMLVCFGCQSDKSQEDAQVVDPPPAKIEIPFDDPGSKKIDEKLKDKGVYYDPITMEKLVSLAYEGDEWAIREIAWPEGHAFHKKGRPFFKNTKPHPQGLIKHSGYEPGK